MRLTTCLSAQPFERLARKIKFRRKGQSQWYQLKRSWLQRGSFQERIIETPDFLKQKGVHLTEPGKEPLFPPPPVWKCPVNDPRFVDPPPPEAHPDWHNDPIYGFNENTKLLEGLKQVSLLSQSHLQYTSPDAITTLMDDVPEIPEQDLLAQRIVLQANRWDPEKQQLPRRPTELRLWRFKSEKGIPYERRVNTVYNGLLRLCQRLFIHDPDLLFNRKIKSKDHLCTSFVSQDGSCIQISGRHTFSTYSNKALPALATEADQKTASQAELPDLYPLVSTVDLAKLHIYKPQTNIIGFDSTYSHIEPHTTYITTNPKDSVEEQNAAALMYCFAKCVARARQLYGFDNIDLPEPIVSHCVASNGHIFNFFSFQLNSLDLSSNSCKNHAWIDVDNQLFERTEPKRAMLRNTTYMYWDPEVLKKFIAYFAHGAKFT